MKFDRVRKEEADTVLKLYRSLLGTPYCVWTEDYPTEKEVEFDFSRDALFCMRDDDGNIIGVISIDDDPNVECLTCWSKTMISIPDSLEWRQLECELWGHMYWCYEKAL